MALATRNETTGYRVFQLFNALFMLLISACTLYPFIYLIAQSFSSEKAIYAGAVMLWPVDFNTVTYKVVVTNRMFYNSYLNTFLYVTVHTAIAVLMTMITAYPLSKPRLKFNRFMLPFVLFTMFFAGGLIPNFVLLNRLGMRNTIWAVVIPGAINTYYLLIMRSFFQSLPQELEEAAAIDGLGVFGVFTKITIPLSKAIIATMVLFYAVDMWNNWFQPFLYLDDVQKQPVTLFLRGIVEGATGVQEVSGGAEEASQIASNIRSTTMVLTALPIMLVYPFIQKYFVQGMMIGSVKG